MARTLPWLSKKASISTSRPSTSTAKATTTSSSSNRATTPPPLKRRRISTPDLPYADDSKETPSHTGKKARVHDAREPSSSPPPDASTLAPPTPELMREDGSDDAWIMVEDELEATAKLFTRHLHYSEYKRLKEHSALKRKRDLLRPVARLAAVDLASEGATESAETVRSLQRRRAKMKKSIAKALVPGDSDSSGEDSDYIRDQNLAHLMHSPQKNRGPRMDLTSVLDRSSSTAEAASQYEKQSNQVDRRSEIRTRGQPYSSSSPPSTLHVAEEDGDATTEDEDDLDMPASRPPTKSRPTLPDLPLPAPRPAPQRDKGADLEILRPSRSTARHNDAMQSKPEEPKIRLSRQPTREASIQTHADHDVRWQKKGPERTPRRLQTKSVKVEEIPTFLV